jgi:hypothetical protein
VNRALVDLVLLSVRGRVLRRFRLLRQPRYLAATIAGLCYFLLVLGPRLFASGRRPMVPGPFSGGDYDAALHLGIGLALALAVTGTWLLVSAKPSLRLSETEIDFLLPAPLPRRDIILYSLLRQQPGLLASTLVVFFLRGSRAGGRDLLGFVSLWALLTLADLHLKGVSLWKARLHEIPLAAAGLRRAVAVTLGALWWVTLLGALSAAWRTAASGPVSVQADPGRFAVALAETVRHGIAGVLLAPFAWLGTPLSGAVLPRAAGLVLLAAVVAAHVQWVVRSRASFEEATLERARREAARKGISKQELQARSARHLEPFRLAPAGPPEVAILWKNLMLRGRAPLRRSAAILGGTIALAAVGAAIFGEVASAILAVGGISLLCGIPLIAGLMLRNDLRTDLLHADILRTWPLKGERLVLAEMLAPAVNALLLLLVGCGLVLAATLGEALSGNPADNVAVLPRAAFAGVPPLVAMPVVLASALVAGMAVALLSLAVQNLAVLVLPSWVGLGLTVRRGTAIVGQRLLLSLGHLLAMILAALPVLAVVGTVVLAHMLRRRPFHLWEVPVLAVVTAVILVVETLLLLHFGGRLWDRLDPSLEIFAAAEGE